MTASFAVSPQERAVLEALARDRRAKTRADRARAVLLAADGVDPAAIAARTKLTEPTVRKWLGRFAAERIAGLSDQQRTGAPTRFGAADVERVVAHTLAGDGPNGAWTTRTLATKVGLSQSSISRIWRSFGLQGAAAGTGAGGALLADDVRDVLGVFAAGEIVAAVAVTGWRDGAVRKTGPIAARLRNASAAQPAGGELGAFLRSVEQYETDAQEVVLVSNRSAHAAGQISAMWSWLERDPRHRIQFVASADAARALIQRWLARLTGAPLGAAAVPAVSRYLAHRAGPNSASSAEPEAVRRRVVAADVEAVAVARHGERE